MKRFAILAIILAAMLAACSDKEDIKDPSDYEEDFLSEGMSEGNEVERERGYYRDNDRKLDFNKEIHYVHVRENNNEALNDRPSGGITSQDTHYYGDDNVLYFFYDAELPTEDTEVIVVEDQFNDDYMLDYKLHLSGGDKYEFNFESIDNKFVNNDNRLYLDSKISISKIAESESVLFSIDGDAYEVKKGENKKIATGKEDVKSIVTVTNYGLFNTTDDMTYQEVVGAERVLEDINEGK